MITWIDHVLCFSFAVVWPLWNYRGYASYRERVRSGAPGTRLAAYAEAMIIQWLFAAAAVALWIHEDRDFGALGLLGLEGRWFFPGLLVAAGLGGLMLAQTLMVSRREETHPEVRATVLPYLEILPTGKNDLTGFVAVSLTAGVCEELLFRGLLPFYLSHAVGPWGGQLAALAVFAVAHSYLAKGAVLRAFLAGGVAAGLYLWTGSLLPGMLLHATVDIASGWMGYEVLRERSPAVPAV
ncbi:MAG TPA: type II CAAX endopeptidase family protein [Vicinamibacteria bacterium]|jgi:membrane protease YdiL (CAAX protease family)